MTASSPEPAANPVAAESRIGGITVNRLARAAMTSSVAIIALSVSIDAHAQVLRFNLPAGEAARTIPEFGRQAGIRISAPVSGLEGKRTPSIVGEHSVQVALDMLIDGLGLEVAANDGRVIVLRRAARKSEPLASYDEASVEGQDIVVTGFSKSLASAQAIKRNSEGVVDAIVAEDIGKFPDVTASAALARVTGVQVNRRSGDAAEVQIRGLFDISTTYNGREIFTAESRSVAIHDFNAGNVKALEVVKSSTADRVEGGIGGQVNVRSRRPFDFDGFHVSGALTGLHWHQSKGTNYNANLLVSNRWETGIGEVGLLINASMQNLDYLDAQREVDRSVTPAPGQPADAVGFIRPNGLGIFYGSGHRWRPSVNASLQWKPAHNFELTIDGLYQGYRAKDRNHWMFVSTSGTGARYSDVVLRNDGSNSVKSMTVTGATRPEGNDVFSKARTDTYQIAGNAVWTPGALKLSADLAYTDSTFLQEQWNIDYAFTRSPVSRFDFALDHGRGGGVLDFVDFDAADPRNYALRGLQDGYNRREGNDIQARLDAEYETGVSFLPKVQAGFRYNDRKAARYSGTRYKALLPSGLLYPDMPLDIRPIQRGFRFDDDQPVSRFPGATFDSVFENVDALRTLAGFPTGLPPFNPREVFTATERAYAGYGQVKYAFDAGFPIDGNIGLRVVRTDNRVDGTSFDAATGAYTAVSQPNQYTDYLPNISLRAKFRPDLQLRLAYTQTRTRPNFGDLNPSANISAIPTVCAPIAGNPDTGPDATNCVIDINTGNPNLKPLQSNNYDLSLEWYYSRTGSLTAGIFRRDVSNFIFRSTVLSTLNGQPDRRVNAPSNGGDGRVQGAEIAFTGFLDFESLPEWARGFGIQTNYTYLDASTELAPSFRDRLPGQQRFPNVSKHAFNLVGMYERQNFSARLAYNWRSEFVVEYQALQNNILLPLRQKQLGVLDYSMTLSPTKNVAVTFDIQNLLGTPSKTIRDYNQAGDSYLHQLRYLERVYSLGLRFTF